MNLFSFSIALIYNLLIWIGILGFIFSFFNKKIKKYRKRFLIAMTVGLIIAIVSLFTASIFYKPLCGFNC